jgi:methionyl aminopeptidase
MINRGTWEVESGPDGWTIRAADRQPSAHYEHMVVVQGGEAEILSTFDYIEKVVEAPYKEEVAHG